MTPPKSSHPAPGGCWETGTGNSVEYPSNSSSTEAVLLTIEVVKLSYI